MANTKYKTFLEKLSSCRLCRTLTQLLRLTLGKTEELLRDHGGRHLYPAYLLVYMQFTCSSQEALHHAIK